MSLNSFIVFALIFGIISNLFPNKGHWSFQESKRNCKEQDQVSRGWGRTAMELFGQKFTSSEGLSIEIM